MFLSIRRVNGSWNERTRVGEGSRDTEASTRSCVVEKSRFLKRDKNFGNMETWDMISGWIRSRNSGEQIVHTVIRGRIDRIFQEMAEEIFQGEKRIFERFQCFSFSFFFLSPTKRNSEVKKVWADDTMESRCIRFQSIITEDVSRKLLENCDCLGQRKIFSRDK